MPFDPVQLEYSRLASFYDRRWSFYVQATVQETAQRLTIQPSEQVLDLGCGTGTLIHHLLAQVPEASYVGLDSSPEMLRVARQKLPEAVRLYQGTAEQLPFPGECFDVVLSTNAFHYFREPAQALQEMNRVLKPSGRLVITDWCHDYWTCRVYDWLLRWFDRAHFRTYGTQDCQALLLKEGLRSVVIERYKIDWLWGMMTAQAMKGAIASER
ncbi:MAG: L-histidine N(alpha)-methyltransferase [Kaiparowitsia implicata GSE-PSE-MK54-09C]|jgi:ubiquinone/menaquinone biosynthesis C-methylase UbiE|nr:L-histidine N(alpha)-methyltransferase [Kaiparowitsia implicata GSE-PSE-MK54-09C]